MRGDCLVAFGSPCRHARTSCKENRGLSPLPFACSYTTSNRINCVCVCVCASSRLHVVATVFAAKSTTVLVRTSRRRRRRKTLYTHTHNCLRVCVATHDVEEEMVLVAFGSSSSRLRHKVNIASPNWWTSPLLVSYWKWKIHPSKTIPSRERPPVFFTSSPLYNFIEPRAILHCYGGAKGG